MASSNLSTISGVLTIIQNKTSLSFSLVHCIFGVSGCFLNILLLSRRQFRTVSCCIYLFVASVSMFIQLSMSSITTIYSVYHQNPTLYISVYCKIWYYLQQSVAMIYRWMLAAACLDRYALSSVNARLRRFAKVDIARRIAATIVIMWILFPILLLVLYDIRAGNCIIIYGYPGSLYNGIFTIINTYVIPISVMTIGTILIRRNLAKKRKRRQIIMGQQSNANDQEHIQRKRDQQALLMLFAQIIVYIILTTPWIIFNVYIGIALNIQNKSVDRLAIERFVFFIVGQVVLLFSTASFYLYTLTSSMFRKELFIMFRSIIYCKCNINNRRIASTILTTPQRAVTRY